MTPTSIQIASGLLGIHHHDDKTGKVFYYEDELLTLLKKWGLPDPDWDGNDARNTEFTKMLHDVYLISPPGAHLEETMEAVGMSEAELAQKMGIPGECLLAIMVGRIRINGFAERLEQIFGIDKQFWINLQKNYDKAIAEASRKYQERINH